MSLFALLVLVKIIPVPFGNSFSQPEEFAVTGDVPCVPDDATAAGLEGIHVQILNATGRPGLAAAVGERLKAHGVTLDEPGNYSRQYYGAAMIIAGPTQVANAYSLARVFPDVTVNYNETAGDVITVVLGDHFGDMLTEEEIEPILSAGQTPLSNPKDCLPVNPDDVNKIAVVPSQTPTEGSTDAPATDPAATDPAQTEAPATESSDG